jgi:hypothetical protein
MSMNQVVEMSAQLPPALREQVIGYAESVDRALPSIFQEIGRKFDREIADEVVFWSAIRKTYGIMSSTFWVLENSSRLIEDTADTRRITIGAKDFTRGGEEYLRIQKLVKELDELFTKFELRGFLTETPRETLLRVVAQ